jgi:excinuclease UvrABC ATPase subunit
MSNVAEMAQLEAAIAEAELTDEEGELVKQLVEKQELAIDEAVQAALQTREPEPEPGAGPAELEQLGEPTEKQLRDLERENERHLEKVKTIMGGFVQGFDACNECSGLGLTPPGPRPQSHEYFEACATCAGFGQVKTGSLRQGNEARDCPACKGRGYLEAIDQNGQALADAPAPVPVIAPPTALAPDQLAPAAPPAQTTERRMGTPSWMGDPTIGA